MKGGSGNGPKEMLTFSIEKFYVSIHCGLCYDSTV